jgi:D-alanine transaminase
MSRIAYVNGRFVQASQAVVSMEDRGYQFADGIYEAIAAQEGVLIDGEPHFDRLERSLHELGIHQPMGRAALKTKIRELLRLNRRKNGVVYIQVTRGAARRNHIYSEGILPILTMSLLPAKFRTAAERENGVRAITQPDQRWSRCDIKAIALLPNMLARMESYRAGAKESWLVRDGVITEGSLSNAYIVDANGAIRTHPANERILGGVRRQVTLRLARELQMAVREEPFTLDDIKSAKEAFMTSCSTFITPIVEIDGVAIGNGKPGPITRRLMEAFDAHVAAQIAQRQVR